MTTAFNDKKTKAELADRTAYDAEQHSQTEYCTHLRRHIENMLDLMADPISPESANAFANLAGVWYEWARHYGPIEGEKDES